MLGNLVMKTFILVDIYNLFFRAMHSINAKEDITLQEGMLLHTMFSMIKKACDKFNPDHLIICSDGNGTWRKEVYSLYKMNRIERLQERSPSEVMRDEHLKNIFENELIPFLKDKTNASFLSSLRAEADDLIARFIALHPNDKIIILSTDNDFIQLLNDNILIYNSMEERMITKYCMLSAINHKPIKFILKDGKVTVSKTDCLFDKNETKFVPMDDWIEYALFTKCIRGDKSDNIFSAYPRVRETSTKKQVGMIDAFMDRKTNGYNWQTFMNSTWENPLGEKKLVKECYEFNKKIIDLNEIPEKIKNQIDEDIRQETEPKNISQVGFNLAKFLKKWNLARLLENIQSFSCYFSRTFPLE